MKTFTVTPEQQERIDKWLMEVIYPPIVAEQRRSFEDPHPMMVSDWDSGYPYQGAIGGGITYEFTPTSIGVIFKVRCDEQTLDLTDYESW